MVKVAERRKIEDEIRNATEFMTLYRCALMEVETILKVLNEQFSRLEDYNPIETIKTRLKTPESIAEKMERRGLPFDFRLVKDEINDIAGVRVVCPFITDIYMLSERLLGREDIRLLEYKDYIKEPKKNGYRSVHLIVEVPIFLQEGKRMVKVEIQLRTIAMDFWASLDHRLSYKKEMDPAITQQLHEELIACSNESAKLDERMEAVRNAIDQRRKVRH
ncbi:MAG: GTP pyrophosphokinase family protein [Lachnospiraceae bacterium]|nr:GTP pyrophosphokinase family protein [Lachnospiraceae bacterium]